MSSTSVADVTAACDRNHPPLLVKAGLSRDDGQIFDFTGDPMAVTDDVVVIDVQEKNTGQVRRVRIPLPVVHTAIGSNLAA